MRAIRTFLCITSATIRYIAKSTTTHLQIREWRYCTTRCCIISSRREDEREYVSEFVYNYGHWSEDPLRELWRRRSRSAADPEYFRYPMIKYSVVSACAL